MTETPGPPKLVAISRVRNEADIIEAFIRHHCAQFDKLIVLDDGSTDETLEMLYALRAQGLPLVVLRESSLAYEQSRYMTRLLLMAVDQFGADWVAPLDADEFLETDEPLSVRDVLRTQPPELLSVFWANFAWTPQGDGDIDPNPVTRMRARLPERSDIAKVIVPARLVSAAARLFQGNHGLRNDGQEIAPVPVPNLRLCHFPIRSPQQYASKVAVGHLKYRATTGWTGGLGFQYTAPFQSLVSGGLQAIRERMPGDSRAYAFDGDDAFLRTQESIDAPLRYQGGPLTSRPSCESTLSTMLRFAESTVEELAATAKRAGETVASLDRLRHEQEVLQSDLKSSRELNAAQAELLSRERTALEQLAEETLLVERRAAAIELELLAARELNFFQANRRAWPRSLGTRLRTALSRRFFRVATELRVIRTSPFFDAAFYLSTNPDVATNGMDPATHYLRHGASEGRDPGPRFGTRGYLARYPDVATSGLNPIVHFELYGRDEGRVP
jgi:hypothetical protein